MLIYLDAAQDRWWFGGTNLAEMPFLPFDGCALYFLLKNIIYFKSLRMLIKIAKFVEGACVINVNCASCFNFPK